MQEFDELVAVLRRLRQDCPWDRDQTPQSLRPFILEEAYELCDAIEQGDAAQIREECGDFAMQFILQGILAEEKGGFTLDEALKASAAKLIARHPHVYGDPAAKAAVKDAAAVEKGWEARKNAARAAAGIPFFQSVPRALPALSRAQKLSAKAATVGFDWPDEDGVIDKIREEIEELRSAPKERKAEEFGDLLLAIVNWARRAGIDPEAALQAANGKFIRRFHAVESRLTQAGRPLGTASLDEMEAQWQAVKKEENHSGS